MKADVMKSHFFLSCKCMRGMDKKRYQALAGGESLSATLIEFAERLE